MEHRATAWLGGNDVLPVGLYPAWQSEEGNRKRIVAFSEANPKIPGDVTPNQRNALLTKHHRQCQIFLLQVGKCFSENQYITILRHPGH